MHVFLCFLYDRAVDLRPVSPVLSSQVTAISNTSSEFAVLLTFKYSIEVSSFIVCLYAHVTMAIIN